MIGNVKWFSDEKGFGFIEHPNDAGQDIFVHHSGIRMSGRRKLEAGDKVSFETEPTEKGLRAVNVTKL